MENSIERGNNSFDKDFINSLVKEKRIIKIDTKNYPFPLRSDETLWFDKTGTVFKADINNPFLNQEKLCTLESLISK